jgi:serine/threonine protein kinase
MSEYVGKGSYGCVIKPNINCNGTFGKNNEITKFFFSKKDYLVEYKNQIKVESVDKKGSFIVKKKSNCKIFLTPEIIKKINNIILCDLNSNVVYQITYEYGGINLYNIFIKEIDFLLKKNLINFLQNFVNIFDGLSTFNKNNIFHNDIKIDNILYNKNNNKFKIIDFGIMNVSYLHIMYNIKYKPHHAYPNELNILGYILDGIYYKDLKSYNLNSNQLVKILEEYILILKELYKNNTDPYFKNVLKLISDIYIYFKIDIFKKFDYTIFEKMLLNKKNLSKKYKEFLNKLDVYMLGLTLYELLINIFIHLRKNPTINKIPLELFSLIKKMVLFNPYERLTIQQATIEFKSIMKI